MAFTRYANPLAVMAVLCLASGFNQSAKALGAGVVVSQATPGSGSTVITVSGNIVDPGVGFNYTAGQAVNFGFTLAGLQPGGMASWGTDAGVPLYFFDKVNYTALSGDTFTGSFIPGNINAGTLTIYQSGRVQFDVASSIGTSYTGLSVVNAINPQALSRYSLQFNVGSNFANVPNSDPGSMSIPSIASLLSGALGSYQVSSGEIVRANEAKATYESVPGPLPILGVGVAFSQSRRIRKRIKSRQPIGC